MSRASQFLEMFESNYYHTKLDHLYNERAKFKVEGKRPPKEHKNYKQYRDLTKKIRKVRSNFAQKVLKSF